MTDAKGLITIFGYGPTGAPPPIVFAHAVHRFASSSASAPPIFPPVSTSCGATLSTPPRSSAP